MLDVSHARMHTCGIELRLRDLGKKTGINKVHPHKFRRIVATKAIDKGMPIEQVQKIIRPFSNRYNYEICNG